MPIKTVMSSFKQSVNAKKREYGGKWPKGGFVGIGDIEYKTSRKDWSMKTVMSSYTQSVYAKKRKNGGAPRTFIGGIPMNYSKYKH